MITVQVRKNGLLIVGALSFLTMLLSGCLKESTSSTYTPKTYISIMHLAPRSPAVQIFINNQPSSSGINPGTVSSSYTAFDPAVLGFTFKKSGGDSVVTSLPSAVYDSLNYYTLLLYNPDSTHVQALRIQDDFSVLNTTQTFYRFFHLCPDVGNVDLYFDNNIIESGRQYADIAATSYYNQFFSKTPSTYSIYVKKAGTDSVIAQASSVSLAAANAYTIYLKGMKGGTGSNALTVDILQAAD